MNHGKKEEQRRTPEGEDSRDYEKTLRGLYACLCGGGDGSNLAEQLHREKESLLYWGEKNFCIYSNEELSNYLSEFEALGGGNEHVVYYGEIEAKVIKITCPPNFGARGNPKAYVQNLLNCNQYLNSKFEIVGLVENFTHESIADKGFSLIISQPFVEGEKASFSEINEFLKSINIHEVAKHTYKSRDEEIALFDVRPDNVMKDLHGDLVFIDVHINVKDFS